MNINILKEIWRSTVTLLSLPTMAFLKKDLGMSFYLLSGRNKNIIDLDGRQWITPFIACTIPLIIGYCTSLFRPDSFNWLKWYGLITIILGLHNIFLWSKRKIERDVSVFQLGTSRLEYIVDKLASIFPKHKIKVQYDHFTNKVNFLKQDSEQKNDFTECLILLTAIIILWQVDIWASIYLTFSTLATLSQMLWLRNQKRLLEIRVNEQTRQDKRAQEVIKKTRQPKRPQRIMASSNR